MEINDPESNDGEVNQKRADSPTLLRSLKFGLYGIVNLLSYSVIYSLLPDIKKVLNDDIESYASIGYGVAAAIGQIVGILVAHKIRVNKFVPYTYVTLCIPTLVYGLLVWIPDTWKLRAAVVAMCFLGVVGASQQLFVSGMAAASSGDSLLFFYVGQSFSGLISYPIVLGIRALVERSFPAPDDRYVLLGSALVCVGLCMLVAIIYLSSDRDRDSLDIATEMGDLGFIWRVFRVINTLFFSVVFVTFVSFAVYPRDICSWMPGIGSLFSDTARYQSALIYIAIAFDVAGMLVTIWIWSFPASTVPWLSAFRVLFVILFWIAGWDYFVYDSIRFPLVILMALSGSMVFGSAVHAASGRVYENQQYAVGQLLSLAFSLGIAFGGVCSHYLGILQSKV